MARLPWILGIRQFNPTRSPGRRLYSLNGILEAPDKPTMRWNQHGAVRTLSAELVDNVGRVPPVGIDQTATNFHSGAVVALPLACK